MSIQDTFAIIIMNLYVYKRKKRKHISTYEYFMKNSTSQKNINNVCNRLMSSFLELICIKAA